MIQSSNKYLSQADNDLILYHAFTENIKELEKYYNQGVNFNNIYTEFYDGILHFVIDNNKPTTFNALINWGIDVNAPCLVDGAKPLNIVSYSGNLQFADPLIQNGANINAQDDMGFTPLLDSLWYEQDHVTNYFLSLDNVNVNIASFDGLSPLILSYADGKWEIVESITNHPTFDPTLNHILMLGSELDELVDYLNDKGLVGDLDILAAITEIKLLGLRYEFDGGFELNALSEYQLEPFGFEGYGNWSGIKAFARAYADYIAEVVGENKLPSWANELLLRMNDVFQHSASTKDPNDFYAKYLAGEPVLLTSGWDEHSISFVLHEDKLYRCNRGELGHDLYGVQAFLITEPENITVELFDIMLEAVGTPDYLQYDIIPLLGLVEVGGIEIPHQIVGNCVWASLEAAQQALSVSILLDMGVPWDDAITITQQSHDNWKQFDLEYSLNKVIQLQDILTENQIYDDLLIRVLDEHHDANDQHEIQRGVMILNEITQPELYDVFDESIGQHLVQYKPFEFYNIEILADHYSDYYTIITDFAGLNQTKEFVYDPDKAADYYDFLKACDKNTGVSSDYALTLHEIFSSHGAGMTQPLGIEHSSEFMLLPNLPSILETDTVIEQPILI